MNEYREFHLKRILCALIGKKFPYNTHGPHGESDCGFGRAKNLGESIYWIRSSLFEITGIKYLNKNWRSFE